MIQDGNRISKLLCNLLIWILQHHTKQPCTHIYIHFLSLSHTHSCTTPYPTPTSSNPSPFPVAVTGGSWGFALTRLNSCTKEPHWGLFRVTGCPLSSVPISPGPAPTLADALWDPQVVDGVEWRGHSGEVKMLCNCSSFFEQNKFISYAELKS